MASMNEQAELKNLEALHADKTFHPVVLTMWDLWQLFEVTTLTLTHPELPDYSREYFTQLAKQFEAFILAEHPQMKDLAKMCWNRAITSPVDAEIKRKLRRRYR